MEIGASIRRNFVDSTERVTFPDTGHGAVINDEHLASENLDLHDHLAGFVSLKRTTV